MTTVTRNGANRGNHMTDQTNRSTEAIVVRRVDTLTTKQIDRLADILIAVTADGASVGYLPPLDPAEAKAYWAGVVRPGNILLIAERDGRIVGTGQLELAMKLNGSHRAEVNKVLVDPVCQRQGIGRRLMETIDDVARREGRTLLHLDTREGDGSNDLYRRMGYTEAGRIPNWARSASGSLDGTVFYFKLLSALPPPTRD
jgi:GNAT superfamily N-acetyltransferase